MLRYLTNTFMLSAGAMLALCPLGHAQEQATETEAEFDSDGFTIDSGDVELTIGGRLHLDTVAIQSDGIFFEDSTDVRRLRVDATLDVGDDWRFKIDGDVGGISPGIYNAWAAFRGIKDVEIKLGNFIAPFNGENMMSSNNMKFVERGLPSELSPNFLLGASISYEGDNWSIIGGYFTNPIEDEELTNRDDGASVVVRGVFSPIDRRREALHFAVAAERRELDSGATSRVRAVPEFALTRQALLDTGALNGIEGYTNVNLEAAYMNGPVLLKAQQTTRYNDAPTLLDPEFMGASVEAAWVITGERQRYSSSTGTFGEIRPDRDNGWGAWEVAARYSMLDLSDGIVAGGEQTNLTVGVNWYANRNVRVSVNYVDAKAEPNRLASADNPSAVMGRLQIAF
jgi:phosphate-selective porin OprO and OprP